LFEGGRVNFVVGLSCLGRRERGREWESWVKGGRRGGEIEVRRKSVWAAGEGAKEGEKESACRKEIEGVDGEKMRGEEEGARERGREEGKKGAREERERT